jgi:hypothetical protein
LFPFATTSLTLDLSIIAVTPTVIVIGFSGTTVSFRVCVGAAGVSYVERAIPAFGNDHTRPRRPPNDG